MNDASSHSRQAGGRRPIIPIRPFTRSIPRFEKYWLKLSAVERLATGLRWAEGPVWFGDGRYLLCSDIPNQRILKWEEETGAVSVFRKPSNFANGNTRDRQGRLVTCEHGGRRVTRTEYDGSITVLIDRFDGKRLNSPNDVVVKSDGSIWFTDPTFGTARQLRGLQGRARDRRRTSTGSTARAAKPPSSPRACSGRTGSPSRRTRRSSTSSSPAACRTARSSPMTSRPAGDKLVQQARAHRCRPRHAGRLPLDIDGNLWCGWGMGDPELDGVVVFAPDGVTIGRIALPERCANVCFGGVKRNRLFMAASQSIYALYVNTQGAPGG